MSASARPRVLPKRWGYDYPRPALTVDMVVLAVAEHDLRVLLIRRDEPPYRGRWALPGGFVNVRDDGDQGEDIDHAAARELHEETGLRPRDVFLQQLRAFGKPGRDPRGRTVSIAYFALVPVDLLPRVRAGDDASEARWVGIAELPEMKLAFDHDDIVQAVLFELRERLGSDLRIAASFMPAEFTKAELRDVFENVSGTAYDKSNFNKRFNRMIEDGVIVEAPGRRSLTGPGRPARLYAFAE